MTACHHGCVVFRITEHAQQYSNGLLVPYALAQAASTPWLWLFQPALVPSPG